MTVDLDHPEPGARRVKAALLDDDTLDELSSLRHALRDVDVDELDDDAAAAIESARESVDDAWREQFESTLDRLQLDLQPCPPSP